MLELTGVNKIYRNADHETYALKDINMILRERELVSILGPSGCGKTSLLNIIGGLDRDFTGELIINGQSTKEYSIKDWDVYRNHRIGFVFQNYNLIPHQTVLQNVELALTISGTGKQKRRARAREVLERVGLGSHLEKKPGQLSGGQMQRVAIARAIVNNPDIILADEPTGALDTETGIQIMQLLEEIAAEKMVIVVTHNPELAGKYSDRIIQMKDGAVVGDNKEVSEKEQEPLEKVSEKQSFKKCSMSRAAAWKLSCSNLLSKKKRTLITNLACSVGITGIALILSLSTGIQSYVEEMQAGSEANNYILIEKERLEVSDNIEEPEWKEYPDNVKEIYPYDISDSMGQSTTQINAEYIDYIENECADFSSEIMYQYGDSFHILCKRNDIYETVSGEYWHEMLKNPKYIEKQCELLAGDKFPTEYNEIALVADSCNRIPVEILEALGIDYSKKKGIDYKALIGKEYRLVLNNNYYNKESISEDKTIYKPVFTQKEKEEAYQQGIPLKVTCVIRGTKELAGEWLSEGIAYTGKLAEMVRKDSADSEIVLAQKEAEAYNVLDGQYFSENTDTREQVLEKLGYAQLPNTISIYPDSIKEKENIIKILEEWNAEHKDSPVEYQDMSRVMSEMLNILIKAITYVLVVFSGITLIASSVMVAIIIYSSVIERTREIGILRALGASRRDVSRVFRTESALLGFLSGSVSIIITWLLCLLINAVTASLLEIEKAAVLEGNIVLGILILSTVITWLAGRTPAKLAAKKDPVEALRME